ncbi:MAG: alpha/beta fold hydrolase [Chloroflexota bacterium]|nr:alpha/beta fold hydrolase [Chloroflexota bacterium]
MRRGGVGRWLAGGVVAVGALLTAYLGYVAVLGSRRLMHPGHRPFEPVEGLPASPADLGLAFENVSFRTDDGLSLSGWLIPAGRPTRAAVVVLHGFTGHRMGELAAFVPWLQPRYNVMQFDFRGHGASDPAPITVGTNERRDIAAAVAFLQDRGFGPIALFGLSMGGAAAIVAGAELPVAAVVADASFAELRNPIANRMRTEGYPFPTLGARAILLAAAVRARARLVSPLSRVARLAPRALLLIAPRDDQLIDYTQSSKLFAAAGEPRELYIVDGAEHAAARWVGGEEYQRRVLGFLDRHLGTRTSGASEPATIIAPIPSARGA